MSAAEGSQVWEGLTLTTEVQKHSYFNYKSILKAQWWGQQASHTATDTKIISKLMQPASTAACSDRQ